MGVASAAAKQFACCALLHDTRTKMECKHRSALLFFFVKFVCVQFTFANWKRLWFISWHILGNGLDIQEYWFLCYSIVILCMNDEFSAIFHLTTVDDESIIITDVSLHILDTLPQLSIVMVPAYRAGCQGDDSTCESRTLSFQSKC